MMKSQPNLFFLLLSGQVQVPRSPAHRRPDRRLQERDPALPRPRAHHQEQVHGG